MKREREIIKEKLEELKLTQVWLIGELENREILTDKTELCSVLAGTRRGAKAENIINTSLDILKRYEEGFVNGT